MSNIHAIAETAPQAKPRFTYQCPECGSRDVRHDATATWCSDLQRFVLVSIQDFCACRACDCEDDTGTSFFRKLEA